MFANFNKKKDQHIHQLIEQLKKSQMLKLLTLKDEYEYEKKMYQQQLEQQYQQDLQQKSSLKKRI